jgi:sugar phosphate permease
MSTLALVEPTPSQLASLKRWRVSTFWVMLVGYVGYYLIRGNLPVALPLISQRFGYTNTELGTILTFSELAYALGKFTTGPLADQMGGKKIFLYGMFGGILFNFVFPLGDGLLYFTVIWCLVRFFLSMGWGGIAKTIGEWYEPERNGAVMGWISVSFQFGGGFAALFAAQLIRMGSDWKGLFYVPAVVVTAVLIWSFLASKESPWDLVPRVRFGRTAGAKKTAIDFGAEGASAKPAAMKIISSLLQLPLYRQVLVFSFLCHILRSFFMFWIPKFMVDMGMGNANAGLTSAVFPLVGCLGTIGLGYYTDRFAVAGDRAAAMWKMLLGLVFSLIAIAFMIESHNNTAIVVLLGFAGLCLYGPYSMSAGCITLDIAGSEGAGTATGLIDGVGYIGGAVAAWGAGLIADKWGWAQVFWSLAAFGLVTVAWVYYMSWFTRRSASDVGAT